MNNQLDLQCSRMVGLAELNQVEKERTLLAEEVRMKIQQAKQQKKGKEECIRLKKF